MLCSVMCWVLCCAQCGVVSVLCLVLCCGSAVPGAMTVQSLQADGRLLTKTGNRRCYYFDVQHHPDVNLGGVDVIHKGF